MLFEFVLLFVQIVSLVNAFECQGEEDDVCSKKVSPNLGWRDFDWESYIESDWNEKLDSDDPMERFGINLRKSIDIGVHREIPENRPIACRSVNWTRSGPLPTTSVIITYRDEPRSTLLRTVVSVLERSPKELIKEIILVDDNNDDATIGSALSVLDKVIVLRNDVREGLIRSRIKGTNVASGEVLVFLDSHCECEEGWLEPLLERIVKDPKTVSAPVIENINLYHYDFEAVSSYLRGGFNWHLQFFWEYLPPRDRARRLRDPTYSFETPAIAGGLFAISRDWFMELGTYDDGMEIWGGENIEFSIRAWTCGGKMEIVPCSKVGHIYKQRNVYSYPKGSENTRECNNRRVAGVWLDEFEMLYNATLNPSQLARECGSMEERKKVRKEMGCKHFGWFLDSIYPELIVPSYGDLAFGQIHYNQPGFLKCLDAIASGQESIIGGNSCLQSFHPQEYRMTEKGLIQQDDFCLKILVEKKEGDALIVSELCNANEPLQHWTRHRPTSKAAIKLAKEKNVKGYLIKNEKLNLCLDATEIKNTGLRAVTCKETEEKQRFMFSYSSTRV